MKQLLTTIVIFAISSLLFIACSNTANESGTNTAAEKDGKSSFDLAAAKKVIDSLNAEFGNYVSKGDSVGLAAMYSSDAKLMAPNFPAASGKSQIQSAFSGMFAAYGPVNLTLTAEEVLGNGVLLTDVGTYKITDKTGKEIEKGKYVDIWKMEDGKWKLYRDIFNSDNPPVPH